MAAAGSVSVKGGTYAIHECAPLVLSGRFRSEISAATVESPSRINGFSPARLTLVYVVLCEKKQAQLKQKRKLFSARYLWDPIFCRLRMFPLLFGAERDDRFIGDTAFINTRAT